VIKGGAGMRFITKQLYRSDTLYGYFYFDSDISYKEFIDNTVHFLKGTPYYRGEESINYIYNSYRIDDYINAFKDDIYRYEDIKKIVLDENDKLKEIDEEIYYKVIEIAREHRKHSDKQYELVQKQLKVLNSMEIPCNIKEFINFSHHDIDIISISHDKKTLSIEFDSHFDRTKTYVFEIARISHDIALSEIVKGFHVVDEEYSYIPNKKMYEYSALLRRRGKSDDFHEIHELNFTFNKLT